MRSRTNKILFIWSKKSVYNSEHMLTMIINRKQEKFEDFSSSVDDDGFTPVLSKRQIKKIQVEKRKEVERCF